MTVTRMLKVLEAMLIAFILVGMFVFLIYSIGTLFTMDWFESNTYFYLIKRVLALAIGVELIRFISSYEVDTLLEILIFLMARQLIHIEIEGDYTHLLPIVISVAIFVGMRIGIVYLNQKRQT